MICISDLHGNFYKAKCFLEYCEKQKKQGIVIGDSFDSYIATDQQIVDTFKLLMNSDCIMLFGNHCIQYLANAHPYFLCSGYREKSAPIFTHLIETYKHRMYASYVVDDYLIVHGGLHKRLGEVFDTIEQASKYFNDEMEKYINSPIIPTTLDPMFNIGTVRGGNETYGGIFWFTTGFEEGCNKFNVISGHTPSSEIRIKEFDTMNGIKKHICVDSPKFMCYNTSTHSVEDFYPEEGKKDDQMRKIYERKY
jgi:hypothetical protein